MCVAVVYSLWHCVMFQAQLITFFGHVYSGKITESHLGSQQAPGALPKQRNYSFSSPLVSNNSPSYLILKGKVLGYFKGMGGSGIGC